jgi:hypothetical protein
MSSDIVVSHAPLNRSFLRARSIEIVPGVLPYGFSALDKRP